ncbi:MAG: EVE domain-containing protein [Anaerolineae bacterium]|nr:EVE domain-containing protein [Anaerolineae bacterium]
MFEINGKYENRKGKYTVLEINDPKMLVRFDDGTEAELRIELQARIWENIAAEIEAKEAKKITRAASGVSTNQHFIQCISLPDVEELTFPGWPEKVIIARRPGDVETVKKGDRVIIYLIEPQVFYAVATITSDPVEKNPKDFFYNIEQEQAYFFSFDIDAEAQSMETAVSIDAVELESYPKLAKMRLEADAYLKMSEDDFELLAELLTEVTEDDDEDEEEDEEDFEEDIED